MCWHVTDQVRKHGAPIQACVGLSLFSHIQEDFLSLHRHLPTPEGYQSLVSYAVHSVSAIPSTIELVDRTMTTFVRCCFWFNWRLLWCIMCLCMWSCVNLWNKFKGPNQIETTSGGCLVASHGQTASSPSSRSQYVKRGEETVWLRETSGLAGCKENAH